MCYKTTLMRHEKIQWFSFAHCYKVTGSPINYIFYDPQCNQIFSKNHTEASLQTLAEPILSKYKGPIMGANNQI